MTNYLYAIQASTNQVNWSSLQTNRVPYGFTNLIDTNYPARFFRALFLDH